MSQRTCASSNYKNFDSVYPLYRDDILHNDFHCLYVDSNLVAWEQTRTYISDKVAFSDQFAWDYSNPEDRVGWRFSYHVPAYYKSQGYKYLYLGDHHDYKSRIQGYEILGPIKTLDNRLSTLNAEPHVRNMFRTCSEHDRVRNTFVRGRGTPNAVRCRVSS